MKKVLLTGSSGFIGRNIKPILEKSCELYAPTRGELDLKDTASVSRYFKNNAFDVVIHSANPNSVKNALDSKDTMFEDSLRCFMNLYSRRQEFERMFFIGSGAEYDKTMDIASVAENDEFRSVPPDGYGLAKYIMNSIALNDEKLCNLRIFACYGPGDHESKFITHCIRSCLKNQDITIRKDCYFDYMHVYDLGHILGRFIDRYPNRSSYNVCSGKRVRLYEIASIVKREMNSTGEIILLSDGMNKEYTGSNERMLEEIGGYPFISLEDGILMQIECEKEE